MKFIILFMVSWWQCVMYNLILVISRQPNQCETLCNHWFYITFIISNLDWDLFAIMSHNLMVNAMRTEFIDLRKMLINWKVLKMIVMSRRYKLLLLFINPMQNVCIQHCWYWILIRLEMRHKEHYAHINTYTYQTK
jgi:hypothetical protein